MAFCKPKVKSTTKKVRPNKGWASADVFIDYQMVVVKARFYQDELGNRLELQRRNGRTVAYNKVYDQVITYYKTRGYGVDTAVTEQPSSAAMDVTPQMLLDTSQRKFLINRWSDPNW